MHSFSELNNTLRKGSQRRIAPSLVIGSPQPSASSSSRGRAVSAVIASQSPALTTTSVKVKDLLRRHRNFRDQTYAVSMFPLHIAMLAVYIIMIQEVSPPMRIQPVSVGIHNSFISQPSVAYNGIKAYYGFDQVSSAKQWWDFLADFTESMYPRCPNGGKDSAATCKANDFSESDDAGERNYNGGSISRRDPTYTNRVLFGVLVRQERFGAFKKCKITDEMPYKRKLTHAINNCHGNGQQRTKSLAFDDIYRRPDWSTKNDGFFFQDVEEEGKSLKPIALNKEMGFWLPERLGSLNSEIVANYSKSAWFSPKRTKSAIIEWVSYNAENSVLAHVTLTTSFDSTGVQSESNIEGLAVDYSEAGYICQAVCLILGIVMLLAFFYRAYQTGVHRGCRAMISRITEFDLLIDSTNAVSLLLTVFLCTWVSKSLGIVVENYDEGFYQDDPNSYAEDRALKYMRELTNNVEYRMIVFKVFSALGFVTQMLQFVKICTFHPQLDVLVKTVKTLVTGGVFFFALFILALFFFAIVGLSIFGDKLSDFQTLGIALHKLCTVLMTADGFNYEGLNDNINFLLLCYFYSFILIMSIIFMNLVLAIVVEAYDKMRENADREASLSASEVLFEIKIQFNELLDTLDNGKIDTIRDVRSHRSICWMLTTPTEKGGLKGRHRVDAGDLMKYLKLTHEGAAKLISEINVEKLPLHSRMILDFAADITCSEELDVVLPALEQLRDQLRGGVTESSNITGQYDKKGSRSNALSWPKYSISESDSMDLESSSHSWNGKQHATATSPQAHLMSRYKSAEGKEKKEPEYPAMATPVTQEGNLFEDDGSTGPILGQIQTLDEEGAVAVVE